MEASVSTQLFGARQVAGPKGLQTSSVAVLSELTLHRKTQRQRGGVEQHWCCPWSRLFARHRGKSESILHDERGLAKACGTLASCRCRYKPGRVLGEVKHAGIQEGHMGRT